MIEPDRRNAIYQLHLSGMQLRAISRQFRLSRNAVRAIIRRQAVAEKPASDEALASGGDRA